MKICILGDTHFGMRGDSLDFHNHIEKFYTNVFFPYLKENNINTVFQMGDLFDRRKFINFNSLYMCRKYFFDKLQENNIILFTILGNHDVAFKNTLEVNSPQLILRDYDNITIFDSFQTIDFDGIPIDVIPWLCDDNEDKIFEEIKSTKSQICLGHFELQGYEMERGLYSHAGLDKQKLSKYDLVLSGHYHHKSFDNHIFYVGTPTEITWSDYKGNKGFHILDTHTREMEFVSNPYRMFYKINYDDSISEEKYKTMSFEKYEGCYVKVIVVKKENPFVFDLLIDNLYKAGVADISIVEDFSELELESNQELIDQAEDTMTILSKFIDNTPIKIDGNKLKDIMRGLYTEALNTETE